MADTYPAVDPLVADIIATADHLASLPGIERAHSIALALLRIYQRGSDDTLAVVTQRLENLPAGAAAKRCES